MKDYVFSQSLIDAFSAEDGIVLVGDNGKEYPSIEAAVNDGILKFEAVKVNADEKRQEANQSLFGVSRIGSDQIKAAFQLMLYVKSQVTATQVNSAVGTLGYNLEINKIGQKKRGRKKKE
ncbi:MAG: hypothetical protein JJU28_02685 [Cyclobacteriaceae bacterium]|nr:hypothetical protein [Cyclobacteriaceae bacterium]